MSKAPPARDVSVWVICVLWHLSISPRDSRDRVSRDIPAGPDYRDIFLTLILDSITSRMLLTKSRFILMIRCCTTCTSRLELWWLDFKVQPLLFSHSSIFFILNSWYFTDYLTVLLSSVGGWDGPWAESSAQSALALSAQPPLEAAGPSWGQPGHWAPARTATKYEQDSVTTDNYLTQIMAKKRSGCSFRIRSPYVREFLAETIGMWRVTWSVNTTMMMTTQEHTSSSYSGPGPLPSPRCLWDTRGISSASTGGESPSSHVTRCQCVTAGGLSGWCWAWWSPGASPGVTSTPPSPWPWPAWASSPGGRWGQFVAFNVNTNEDVLWQGTLEGQTI